MSIISRFLFGPFRTGVEALRPVLYRIAYAWCHDAALADDLVQETLSKAWARRCPAARRGGCPSAGDQDTLEIVNWVMSCRVFGRQLEDEVMNIAVEAASKRCTRRLLAEFIPTSKNNVIRGLYERLGFSKVGQSSGEDAATRWALDIDEYRNRPTFIRREAQTA